MCNMNWHVCDCGSEYRCLQSDYDCPVFNGYNELCGQCEWYIEEEQRAEERNRHLDYELEQEYLNEYESLMRDNERS